MPTIDTDNILIFDFDGVLADTFDLHVRFLRKLGISQPRAESFLSHASLAAVQSKFLKAGEKMDKLFYRMLRTYVSRRDNYLFDDIFKKVIDMNQNKYILSMGSKKYIVKILGSQAKTFKDIYGRFEIKRNKALGFDLIRDQHNIDPEKTIFFTDTVRDIEVFTTLVPKEKIFAVDWGYCSREELLKYLPEEQVLSKEQFKAL